MALATPSYGSALPLRRHVLRTVQLALPVMIARAGILIMATVDTVMAGHVGADALAAYAIASVPMLLGMLVSIGLLTGTVVLTAQSDGAGRPELCGRIWRLALLNALALGLLTGGVLLLGAPLLRLLGQAPELAQPGGEVLRMFALGMPPALLFAATSFFLEGIGRPRAATVVMVAANVVNAALNVAFMFGPLELGATGAALATSLARWFMFLSLAMYALRMAGRERYGVTAPLRGHVALEGKLVRIGLPMGLSYGLEHTAFMVTATFAGWLGTVPMAAYQICVNLLAVIYMLAVGIATATAVRVGNAVGRGDQAGVGLAGWVGVGLGAIVMLVLAPTLLGLRWPLTGLYTDDVAVRTIAATALVVAAAIPLADATQGILVGALRGCADVWPVIGLQLVVFGGLAIPVGYTLGHVYGYGVPGLLGGLLAGLAAAALLLGMRFRAVAARPVRPV